MTVASYAIGDRLTKDDGAFANALLDHVRRELETRADGDPIRLHMLRRRVIKTLGYDEKSTPMERKKLKLRKMAEQNSICTICGETLPEGGYYAVLDRKVAHLGYTDANVNLVHADCDYKAQAAKGYA